jgi:hypothetical protein
LGAPSSATLEVESGVVFLTVLLAVMVFSPIVGVFIYAFSLHQDLIKSVMTVFWGAVWISIFVGLLATSLFSRVRVDGQGVSIAVPLSRILGYKGYPSTFGFDEYRIKLRGGGRIITVHKGNAFMSFLFYNFWFMPIKWKECKGIIEANSIKVL